MRITKNQLRQIIKEELSLVLREGVADFDLKMGGLGGEQLRSKLALAKGDQSQGVYDPYTVGELGSDIKSGVGSFFGLGGGEDFEAMDDGALKDRLATAQAGMVGGSNRRGSMNDAAKINRILDKRAEASGTVRESKRRRKLRRK